MNQENLLEKFSNNLVEINNNDELRRIFNQAKKEVESEKTVITDSWAEWLKSHDITDADFFDLSNLESIPNLPANHQGRKFLQELLEIFQGKLSRLTEQDRKVPELLGEIDKAEKIAAKLNKILLENE